MAKIRRSGSFMLRSNSQQSEGFAHTMSRPITFVLNTEVVTLDVPTGRPLLDAIRVDADLKGTKHACREGDCGSCVVLVGEPTDGTVRYRAMTSCLMPVAAAAGCHVITIEGLDPGRIGPLQQPFVDEGASQCGFCTPGFLVSLAGHLLNCTSWDLAPAFNSLAGNICRCTGYASIQRATARDSRGAARSDRHRRTAFRGPGPRRVPSRRPPRGARADPRARAAAETDRRRPAGGRRHRSLCPTARRFRPRRHLAGPNAERAASVSRATRSSSPAAPPPRT